MRKVSKLFLLISLSFLLTFNSCNNVFENSVSAEENTSAQNNASQTDDKTGPAGNRPSSNPAATIVFGGSLAINGAVPAEFVEPEEAAENQQNGRSANAELPGSTDYEYYVKATSNDGLVHEDIIPAASISKDYSLQLEINKTWTFTAGYRKKASGTPGTDSYVAPVNLLIDIDSDSGHPYSLTLSETVLEPATQKVFTLKPLQNGSGTINLAMTAPESGAGITALKLFTSGENGVLTPWQIDALDVTTTSIKTKENMTIASGSYDVTMIFYSGEFQAYITYQTINVFDNMETKVWESGNAPGTESIISGGSFQLTTSLVQKFASSTIYVGAPEGVTVEPDDSRVGSPYAPVKTLNRAFEIIKANTSGDGNTRDYRILVTTAKPTAEKAAQPQKANLKIWDTITSTEAKSIEIVGIGTSPELRPAATNPGTVLTVKTAVPVKLSNIKITGGQGSGGKGGALSITQNSAKVTLGSGTVITGNEASDQGGGIYIQGTDASHKPKLIIQNGAEIKSNSIGTSGTGGMAIFADCAEVEMTGGEISDNSKAGAQYGAVRLTGASEFTMTGGSVANNDGGAFYVDSDYDSGTSTYTHSKLKIGGSASIPYGVNGTTGQKKNDVYIVRANQTDPSGGKYSPLEIAGAITVEDGTKIAAITPDGWQRGLDILKTNSGIINDYKDYFITTDPYFILSNQATAQISKLKAPVVVSNNPSKNPSDSNSGTREHPYATLAFALSQLGGGEEDTILIDGLISTPSEEPNGKYEIPASFIVSQCSALTLKGANGLNTDGTPKDGFAVPEGGSGSVLTVDSPVPVKIENLKLTGGKGTQSNTHYLGGGLYLNSGTVTLADGAQITGNRATHGAGILIESNGTLYMYGRSLIGEKKGGSITSAPSVYSQASNYCYSGHGGGIYSKGNVFIGYERWSSDTDNTPKAMAEGYGILHNFAGSQGGGLISMGGKVRMASGTIGINYSGDNGGGFCELQSTDCILSGGSMEDNVSKNGGAIYIGTNLTAELKNNLEIKNNEARTAGGAVYVAGTLKIQDAVSIPYGVNGSSGAKKNDVYLNTDKTITVSGSFSSSAPVTVATITLPWARGAQFLQAGDTLTSLPDGVMDKFSFTDPGWDKKRYTKSSTNDAAKIDADIYVAGSNPAKCKRSDGASDPTDDNTIGNWAHPFASISAVLSSGLLDASHDTIIVDGIVSGAQSISGTGSLSAIAIKGYKAAGATPSSAMINAGGTSGAGSALTVNADGKTVTIQDLTITGGRATNGGGINITKGSVALGTGAKVTGNIASESGGGVYLSGSDAKLFMYDSSLIGDDAASTTIATDGTSAGSTTFANKAVKHGGGIYNNGGAVYIGYSGLSGGSPVKSDMTNGGGVRRNISTTIDFHAGGIMNRNGGTVRIASGSISYNFSTTHGGGLYNNNDAGEVRIEAPQNAANKVVFEGNHAKGNGGAIFNRSTLAMSAGQIGGSTSGLQNTVDSGAKGGAIFQDGSFTISGSAVVYAGSETVNDVCLGTAERTVAVGSLSGSGTVASITPASWSRGTNILSATSEISSDVYNRFVLSKDNAGWDRANNNAESTKYVFITSPIYVVDATDSGNTRPTGFNKGVTTANGTKSSPYASVADALTCADLATVKEITIAGTLKGAQTISTTSISELKLKGYKASGDTVSSAKIDAGGATGAGSALTVNKSGLTVTITDLTITGGSGSSMTVGGAAQTNGGGILLNAGTVKLSNGAVITGNAVANNGGGVYLSASGCALYMSGTALIGDSATSTTRASSAANNRANQAANGAGIYNNGGSVFIGSNTSGTAASGYSLVNDDTNGHYGVRRNYSTTSGAGAGIYHAGGTLKIASGDISNNNAGEAGTGTCNGGGVYCAADVAISGGTFKNNYAANGGGLYIATGKKATVNGAAVFTQNQSWVNGGAVYNAGEFTMSAGTIGGSNSSDANLAAGSAGLTSYGGAIYQGGTFNVSGSAWLPYGGAEKKNDVYLDSNKYITIAANNLSKDNVATITPVSWARGKQVLDAGTNTWIASNYSKFAVSDDEWSVGYYVSGTATDDDAKRIGADLWVAGTNPDTGVGTTATASDSNRGTKKQPYATISNAAKQVWDTTKTKDFTIYVSGKLVSSYSQYITNEVVNARSILVTGTRGSSYDIIDRNMSDKTVGSTTGDALAIQTGAVIITLEKLKITGGFTTSGGGAIYLYSANKDAKLNLGNDLVIQGNRAAYGGAVYVSEGCSLCLYGTATIGDPDASAPSSDSTDLAKINKATSTYGGAIVNSAGAVYLGAKYKEDGTLDTTNYPLTKGIYANVASTNGGGIYSLGAHNGVYMYSGNVSYNTAGSDGGGVYIMGTSGQNAVNGTLIMNSTAIISGNSASGSSSKGGGVYLKRADLYMSGSALIGDTSGSSAATSANDGHSNIAANGGGVYCDTGASIKLGYANASDTSGTTLDSSYGIRHNYASNCGGGVYLAAGNLELKSGSIFANGTNFSTANKNGGGVYVASGTTLTINGGSIAKNSAYNGGGVYTEGAVTMSAGAIGDSSKNKSPLDLTTTDYSNSAVSYGGGIYSASGSSVSISGGYVNYNWGDRGGGVYSSGSFAMTGGNISFNATNTGNGGGVYFNADATLTSGTLQGNKSHYGGAIYISSGKTVTIDGALALTSNGSVPRGNPNTEGGAIYNGGSLNITGAATFTGNSANGSTTGNAYGGAIFNEGSLTISAGVSINNNSATASGSGKLAYGGAIYNYGTLTMSAGSVGTTTMNTVTSSGTSGVAQGGAIYQAGSFIVSGSINLYNSSNAATKNDVYLHDSEKRVVLNGKLTNSNTTVMKITPNSYTFGAYVVEKGGSINESNFKSSLEKIGLIPSGIYSGVAYSSNNYSAGATTWTGYRGVVGIDFNSITENQIKSYTFDSVQQDYAGGVHYILLKNSSGKYGAIEFNVARTNASNGTITAKYVVFNSSRETGNLQSVTYQTGSYMMGQALINWKPFGNDDAASLMWDGTSIVMYVATSYNNMTGHWLY